MPQALCSGCHGELGVSENPAIPSLAGQDAQYFIVAMKDYKDGSRHDEPMKGLVAPIEDAAIKNMSAWYASQQPRRRLKRIHGNMLPPDEVGVLITWVEGGTDRAKYESDVRPLLEKRCMICHDGSNPHLRNLNGYDNLKKVTERDTGTDVFTLVRVSHIHLFGLTFVFFIMGLMYSHAYVRPVWFKCAIIALPYVAIAMDVSSWYFTKLFHPFAWVVIVSGGIMGACFAFMWAVTMYQMWLAPPPAMVAARVGGEIAIDG